MRDNEPSAHINIKKNEARNMLAYFWLHSFLCLCGHSANVRIKIKFARKGKFKICVRAKTFGECPHED